MNNLIYIDSRENDRAERFVKYLEKYLEKNNSKTKIIGEMKPIRDKWKKSEPYYKITELPHGDYIYDNVIVEFKGWEDFKTSMRNTRLNYQIEDMVTQTNFKDKVLIVDCNDEYRHFNNDGMYKSIARFGGKINCNVVRSENEAFDLILYLFRLNANHIDRSPTDTVKKKNWILSVIYTSRVFSYAQAQEIVKKTAITTLPQLLTFFNKDTEYIHKALSIPRVTVKKIDDFKKMLNGEILL